MPSYHMVMTPAVIFALIIAFTSFPNNTEADYRHHFCSNTTTFTPNSVYQSNLNLLLTDLTSNATRNGGFDNTIVASGELGSEGVYGSFLCRGDLKPADCLTCVGTAAREVVQEQYCPVEKVAVIWYDECALRYSNVSFFGNRDEDPRVYFSHVQNITDPAGTFTQLLGNTMNDAVEAATSSSASNKIKHFATREANFSKFLSLYSLVQCTPDISSLDCVACLGGAVGLLPMCCAGKKGGRVLSPSCNIRFETYPFYNVTASPPNPTSPSGLPSPPPPPSSTGNIGGNGKISPTTIIAVCVPIAVLTLVILVICFWRKRRARAKYNAIRKGRAKRKYNTPTTQENVNDITTVESLQFAFRSIETATNNFSESNKLGRGGFGEVYKGTFENGQEIAVKRLSKSSEQGAVEFKNEVVLVAKLQHKNLVRLLGFCMEGDEKILVYEHVPNKSLDSFLFDPKKRAHLNWPMRCNVIEGIARGILYLHEDSRLKIIHRDLKASNILLDKNMNPKVSDFGMAKIFGVDQTQGNTNRIVGTYGYMAPEYAMKGLYSIKSDAFSFGVLLLEILSGRKNSSFHIMDCAPSLVAYAWQLWNEGKALDLIDPCLKDSYYPDSFMRYIHIALLCVQEDAHLRPTMSFVVLILKSEAPSLSQPERPAFVTSRLISHHEIIAINSDSVNEMTASDFPPR